jgi:hypothetical protein
MDTASRFATLSQLVRLAREAALADDLTTKAKADNVRLFLSLAGPHMKALALQYNLREVDE